MSKYEVLVAKARQAYQNEEKKSKWPEISFHASNWNNLDANLHKISK